MIIQSDLNTRERALNRLGLTVRVRYLRPTNTKGGRYVAEVCGDDNRARVFVCSQLCNRCESTRLAAAERCLEKWQASRAFWWLKETGKEWGLPGLLIKSVGSTGTEWLFFCN